MAFKSELRASQRRSAWEGYAMNSGLPTSSAYTSSAPMSSFTRATCGTAPSGCRFRFGFVGAAKDEEESFCICADWGTGTGRGNLIFARIVRRRSAYLVSQVILIHSRRRVRTFGIEL